MSGLVSRVRSLNELPIKGEKVLIRADLNVPQDDQGKITDQTRIREFLPTVEKIIKDGGIPIVMSHLRDGDKTTDSLKPIADCISKMLPKVEVRFAPDCIGEETKKVVASLKTNQLLVLENTRFHKGESKNDPAFAKELASLGTVYINDAFGTAHRKHASTYGVGEFFGKDKKGCGLLIQAELDNFERALLNPKRPLAVVIGGAKISSKLGPLQNLAKKAQSGDIFIIGGGMANTFLAALGINMGRSLVEQDKIQVAKSVYDELKAKGCNVFLPEDAVVGLLPPTGNERELPISDGVPAEMMCLDIGPKTRKSFKDALQKAGTVVWNGPMGAFDLADQYSSGTREIAETISKLSAFVLAGGGETAEAVQRWVGPAFKQPGKFLSTGGGASLELLEKEWLPALDQIAK